MWDLGLLEPQPPQGRFLPTLRQDKDTCYNPMQCPPQARPPLWAQRTIEHDARCTQGDHTPPPKTEKTKQPVGKSLAEL